MRRLLALSALIAALAAPLLGAGGKWTPTQLLELDPGGLREQGLEIQPDALWNADGAGLLDAAIKIGGCSAGFVSPDGLVITNHHCVFGILQHHSTPGRDLITDGFIAPGRGDEIGAAGTRATIPHRVHDVTARIEASVPPDADDLARYRAIEAESKSLVAECELRPARRCRVAAYDGGVRYELIESLEYPDVRLVYAPPRAIGEYGGEVDNWSWPRHTGDFSLIRVWAAPDGSPAPPGEGNVPFRPNHFFPVSTEGVAPGDFVLLAGYPGRTYRALTAPEMAERAELYFPRRAELYGAWIEILTGLSGRSDGARIALAGRIKSLANREKNARGQLAGIARGGLLEKRRAADREVLAWAAGREDGAAAVAAHAELEREADRIRERWDRDFLLEQIPSGPVPLALASKLVRWAGEKAKPDAEREPDYMERNRERLRERLERAQTRLHRPADEALLVDLLLRLRAAGGGELVASLLGTDGDREAVEARVAAIHEATRVTDAAARAAMFDESERQLRERGDPLLELAFALDPALLELEQRQHRHEGAISRLRPVWRRAVEARAGRPVAPDANGTLRVSLARVRGYEPRDAVSMEPRTTVAGLVAKHTGEEPFAAPSALLAAAPEAPGSRWSDAALGDVPVCFLADGDTTGGNSGSPVLDARGRLVGVNFDRVWENVANDFGYNPEIARNISVDVRFLFWVLETLEPARSRALRSELGIAVDPAD